MTLRDNLCILMKYVIMDAGGMKMALTYIDNFGIKLTFEIILIALIGQTH